MKKPKKSSKPVTDRRKPGHSTELPVFIKGACEFSDDPTGLDNAVWVVRAIKRELSSGQGPHGSVWADLTVQIAEAIAATKKDKKSGRKRMPGDWLLLFVGYVMSKQPEMAEFHKNEAFNIFWEEAGFDLAKKPGLSTLWDRFTELENPQIVRAIGGVADLLIRNAMEHDPEISNVVHIDATGFHSKSVPHHACLDPESCDCASGPKTIEVATSRTVKEGRWKDAEQPVENEKPASIPVPVLGVVPESDRKRGEFKKFVMINGHRYGLHDAQAGARAYTNPDGSNKEFWIGGYDIAAIDGKYGAKLQGFIAPADRQECNLYFPLMRRLEQTTGRWPQVVTGDRGHSLTKIFRFNTRRGIATVFPFRRQKNVETREGMRTEEIDEHGIIRCPYCGSECEQVRFELRKSGTTKQPTFLVRCTLGLTPHCEGKLQTFHPEDLPNGWRLLLPLSRLSERYHALKAAHKNMEHVFRHQRQRYRTIGNDETGKLKRFGTDVHELRCEVARMLEWFRLSIRFGWIGSERRYKKIFEVRRRGHHALKKLTWARIRRGLSLPYGEQAFRLGWAPTPDVPPPRAAT